MNLNTSINSTPVANITFAVSGWCISQYWSLCYQWQWVRYRSLLICWWLRSKIAFIVRRLSIVDSIQSANMGDICSRKISFFTKINLRCEWSIKIYVKLQRLSIKAVVYNDLTPKLICFMISDCPDRICCILRVIITTCHEIFFIYMD